jgi:outer membrane protein
MRALFSAIVPPPSSRAASRLVGLGHPVLVVTAAFLVVACGAPPGRPAETADGASEGRVGVVDLERVLRETERGQQAAGELERMGTAMQAELEAMASELEERATAVNEAREAGAADEELARMAAEYQQSAQVAQQTQAGMQARLEQRRAELTGPILRDVQRIASRIGSDEGFMLIIDRAGVAFWTPTSDVTDRLIAELESETASASIEEELADDPQLGEPAEGAPQE